MSFNPFNKVVSFWRFAVDVMLRWYHGGIGDLAAGVTFWVLISLPAFVLAMLAVLGPIDSFIGFGFQTEIQQEVEEFLARVLTDDSGDVKEAVTSLFEQSNTGLFTISLGFALWSISRGFAGLIRALEDIYGIINGRPWYITRVVAVVLGLGTMLIALPLVALEQVLWVDVSDGFLKDVGRYLSIIASLVLWASIIYYFGPAQRNKWHHDLPGALVAALLWIVLYLGFGRFVSLLSGANEVTAAISAGLFALSWIWLAAQALLIGGAVNYLYGIRRGVVRHSKTWSLNEKIASTTGEIKKVIIDAADNSSSDPE